MFKQPLFRKLITITLLSLILLIPLAMIEGKISERKYLQSSVEDEIAQTSAGNQQINGPFIVVYYKLRNKLATDEDGRTRYGEAGFSTYHTVFTPNQLLINAKADVTSRQRGIYKVRLFNLNSHISGDFVLPKNLGLSNPSDEILPLSAYFVVSLGDARGIRNSPKLQFKGKQILFKQGAMNPITGSGMHAKLDMADLTQEQPIAYQFNLDLEGTKRFAVSPVAEDTQMKLTSTWPHPSFNGQYLPRKQAINEQGFSAQWQVPKIARNTSTQNENNVVSNEVFAVDFIDPVNVYLLSERAVKYGLMFVVLVFTGFFLFEISQALAIHPMQYLLVGLAMAMFFLLMISLSEHISFAWAYLIAGFACVALIEVYLAGILNSHAAAMSFATSLGLMYGLLYGVLQSEDNALLMGTCVMFTALAAVMILTRKMDWYQLQKTV